VSETELKSQTDICLRSTILSVVDNWAHWTGAKIPRITFKI